MFELAVMQWTVLEDIYYLFSAYPVTFLLLAIVWIGLIYFFKKVLHVYVSPWYGLMLLVVSAAIIIGILLSLKNAGYIAIVQFLKR